jgi:prepilin-type N-terminal cleavage/methylation domain-containing protein
VRKLNKNLGFTLIEVLVVVAILAIFASVVYAVLNPLQRLKDARDGKRGSDVKALVNGISEYIIDNKGAMPPGFPAQGSSYQIGSPQSTNGNCAINIPGKCVTTALAPCYDLTANAPSTMANEPIDPKTGASASATGYMITLDTNNVITATACNTEGTTVITAVR